MAGNNPISMKVNLDGFRKAAKDIADNAPVNGKTVIRNQTMLLLEDLVKLTKPHSKVIAKNIQRVANNAFQNEKTALFLGPKPALSTPDKATYNRYRFKKGGRNEARKIVAAAALSKFIKEEKTHIGMLAASWIGSGNPLKAKVPAFAKKHIGKSEGSTKLRETPISLTVTVTNFNHLFESVPKVQKRMFQLMNRALLVNSNKMKTILKNLLKYGGKYKMRKQQ